MKAVGSNGLKKLITLVKNAFASKQDTISDLATIRSGASLGATAIQNTNNCVHLTADESISGTKTFNSTITTSAGNGIKISGTDYSFTLRSSGSSPNGAGLFLNNNASNYGFNTTNAKITIGGGSIVPYTQTPTEDTTSSTQIDTVGARNTKLANYVDLSTSQTISGSKTFTATEFVKDTTNVVGTTNTWFSYQLQFRDKNGTRVARLQPLFVDANGVTQMGMYASNGTTSEAGIYVRSNGITYSPTPNEDTTSSTQIDTVGARNTKINSIVRLKTTYINGTSGYRIWTDGYCEQWGTYDYGSLNEGTTITISYVKTFKDTNYSISAIAYRNNGNAAYRDVTTNIISKSTGSFIGGWWRVTSGGTAQYLDWRACGYLASGQY